jgi:hypothetical protein
MANNQPPSISLTISLPDIYGCLCPICQEAFLALLEQKATHGMLRESLRRQLDPSCHSERSEESLPAPS